MICDFCSGKNPRFCYTTACIATICEGIALGMGYDERWSACPECAAIIDRKDRSGLVKRAIETFIVPPAMPVEEHKRFLAFSEANLRSLYDAFFDNLSDMRKMCLEEAERPPKPPTFGTITIPVGGAS